MTKVYDVENSINDRIASETKVLHERNNKIASLKMVMALRSADLWREYVRSFYWLFLAFEEEVRKIREGPEGHLRKTFEAVHEPLLLRAHKIRKDLSFYYDQDKTVLEHCNTAEGKAYVEHVQGIARDDPIRLMAYLSVMYLGLFAGGQIIKSKMVRRTGFYPAKAGLDHAEVIERGTNIFNFDTDDTTKLKETHRSRFDRVCLEHLSGEEKDKVVEEAKEIFVRNESLIASVEVPSTAWLLLNTLRVPLLAFSMLILICFAYFGR